MLRSFLPFARPYRTPLILTVLSMTLLVGVQLAAPLLVRRLLATIEAGNTGPDAYRLVTLLALAALLIYLARAGLEFVRSYMAHVAGWGVVADVRRAMYRHLQRLSLRFYEDKQTGQLMSRTVNDSDLLEKLIAHAVPDVLVNVFMLLGVSAAPALLGQLWPLALIPIAYIAAITAVSRGEVHGGGRHTGWLAVGLIGAVLAALIALGLAGGEPAWAVLPFAALLAWRVLPPFVAAARAPRPALIGAAVRAGVLSLILLDAALATAFAGPLAGAAVLALWPLSLGLARLFAVT